MAPVVPAGPAAADAEWLDRSGSEDEAWRNVSGLIAATAHLDLAGAREVYAALRAVVEDAGRRSAGRARPGTRRMHLGVLFFSEGSADDPAPGR